ncbi:MAG: flavodoxin family protein [Coprobacillus sp.]
MKYSIIYSSQTGNGKLLAETIAKNLPQSDCDYMGSIKDVDSELLFVGFWTDKGSCDETLAAYLDNLHNKKIFLFGTAGFGGNQEYFERCTRE